MNTYKVKSASSKLETLYLLITFVLILLISSFLLKLRYKPVYHRIIQQNEISSYQDFNSIELGIYTEILNSLMDIEIIKDEINEYPNENILKNENIPPFAKDKMWQNKGSMEWQLVFYDENPIYIGMSGDYNIVGNFILVINKNDIDKSIVYYTKKDINTSLIKNRFENIKGKLKRVVSYTGNDERKKFKEN